MNDSSPQHLSHSSGKALIVGGSLGGLFAATALRAIGWQVDVFERSPAVLDSRGGGIVLQPPVIEAFDFAGIKLTQALGVRSRQRVFLDAAGRIRHSEPMPQTQTSWNTLYRTLISAIPNEHYHRGATLIDIRQDADAVTAIFEDGSHARGDLLIGADGASSTVRRLLLPELEPAYSGYLVWRGLVDERDLPNEARACLYENFVFQQSPDSLMLTYMVPGVDGSTRVGERRYNWLWYLKAATGPELDAALTDQFGRRRAHSIPPGSMAPDQEAVFRTLAKGRINPGFLELICRTDEIFVQSIMDLKVPQMVFDRALLTGDAAFIPRPHTAGSTAKAATNALTLARALRGQTDIHQALDRWQRDQVPDGVRMVDWGISMGNQIMGIKKARKA
jgi:2-polyprenyl-6-methoxyphenol hydroxylase-like FAD-dependent oxidoreductase